jgi:hypothetical protein
MSYQCNNGEVLKETRHYYSRWRLLNDNKPYEKFGGGDVSVQYASDSNCVENVLANYDYVAVTDCFDNPSPCFDSQTIINPQIREYSQYAHAECSDLLTRDTLYDSELGTCSAVNDPEQPLVQYERHFYVVPTLPPAVKNVFVEVEYYGSSCGNVRVMQLIVTLPL